MRVSDRPEDVPDPPGGGPRGDQGQPREEASRRCHRRANATSGPPARYRCHGAGAALAHSLTSGSGPRSRPPGRLPAGTHPLRGTAASRSRRRRLEGPTPPGRSRRGATGGGRGAAAAALRLPARARRAARLRGGGGAALPRRQSLGGRRLPRRRRLLRAERLPDHDRCWSPEWAGSGRIDLTAFWVRRARRLLPALVLVMLGDRRLRGGLRGARRGRRRSAATARHARLRRRTGVHLRPASRTSSSSRSRRRSSTCGRWRSRSSST